MINNAEMTLLDRIFKRGRVTIPAHGDVYDAARSLEDKDILFVRESATSQGVTVGIPGYDIQLTEV